MVIQKTWRILSKKMIVEFAIYGFIVIAIFVGVQTDIVGFENKLPEREEITGVYYGNNTYELRDEHFEKRTGLPLYQKEDQYIDVIYNLHQAIITKKPEQVNGSYQSNQNIVIAYELNNGDTFVREYQFPIDKIEESLKPVMESEIYKGRFYQLKDLEKTVDKITIKPSQTSGNQVVITKPSEIQDLKEILKQEILMMDYEEMHNGKPSWATIELLLSNNNRSYLTWKKSYVHIERWLKENGYFADARIFPSDIEKLSIAKVDALTSRPRHANEYSHLVKELPNKMITVTDKGMIEEALNNYQTFGDGAYYLEFKTKQERTFHGLFSEKDVPASIKQLFQ